MYYLAFVKTISCKISFRSYTKPTMKTRHFAATYYYYSTRYYLRR